MIWCRFFSGAFDDPDFDDVNHPTAQAGITCTGCHAITHVNSPRGNADYTIEEPLHYPFATSDSEFLQWVNQLLVKAKPAFHQRTFLKPLHQSPEFCGTCHQGCTWPRNSTATSGCGGQNHYDPYHLSGVSGPWHHQFLLSRRKAEHNCNGCHMPLHESDDFGARSVDGTLQVHDHQFSQCQYRHPPICSACPNG